MTAAVVKYKISIERRFPEVSESQRNTGGIAAYGRKVRYTIVKMTKTLKDTLKKYAFRGIRFKMAMAVLVASILLLMSVEFMMDRSIRNTVEELMSSRMTDDLQYINDLIEGGEWHIENGALYRGETLIGDGTEENAFLDPFLELEKKTGSFSYAFVRCSDEGLTWTGDKKTGYQQGHYMRVAGSTLSPVGKKIMGTYMDRKVSDILDAEGYYSGRANVTGGLVYCLYTVLKDNEGKEVGVLVVGRSIADMEKQTLKAEGAVFGIITFIMILIAIGLNIVVFRWIAKLDAVNNYLRNISGGVFPKEPLNLNTGDELLVTAQCINEMTESLKEKERISGELRVAADIQAHMLPCIFPAFPERYEFDIFASMAPAKEVGGDFYDFFMIDDEHLAVVIADVSGKGVPAALFMVIAKTMIKNYAHMGMELCDVFTKVNRLLCDGNEAGIFVTAWAGILDLESGRLTYVNAGHNPPLIKLGDGGYTYLQSRPGFVLAGMETTRYKQNELMMQPGDRLFLYTDGVTEAINEEMELYGTKRLNDYLNLHINDRISDLVNGLKADIERFSGDQEQFDDITMLILDYLTKSTTEKMNERTYAASVDSLKEVMAFTEGELEKADCPAGEAMQISVAVEEIFVNIAYYAYPGECGRMKFGIDIADGIVTIRFVDYGTPFDPLQMPEPDVSLDAESRKIGGLGIYMVKKTMDDVKYERKDNQNILILKKKIR